MRYRWILLAAPMVLAGCYAQERQASRDTITQLRTEVDQLKVVSAQRDTAMKEIEEATRFINDVNTELSRLTKAATKSAASGDMPTQTDKEARDAILKRAQALNARVLQGEARLRTAMARVDSLSNENQAMKEQLGSFEQMIASLKGVVEQQKNDLLAISDSVTNLKAETTRLSSANAMLSDTVGALTTRENTVFYVVGTKQELLAQGLVAEEGGTRLLIFGKHGKSLVPARALDSSKFTAIDRRNELVIDLPNDKAGYKIVSRQNPMYLDSQPDKDGKYHDQLVIRDPSSFWAASRYLIVVID
jgi:hypothetical protein